ncbi:MAG TPA: DUF899 family protein [Sphingomonas sp.]|nr:DUF899 family protein [Sphingomonas sp.]
MVDLKPASEMAAAVDIRFPNESPEYRAARTALLAEEIELRRHIERVAEMRRALPAGGAVSADFRFVDENGSDVGLIDMFGPHDTLITYHWMFGPQRERPCPMCTSFLGGLAAATRDLTQQVAVAVIGRSPIERQIAFKLERGWGAMPLYQAKGDDFSITYGGLLPDGSEVPALNVFERFDGGVRHFYAGEMTGETADPGQDPRGAPDLPLIWTLFDLTRRGRDPHWYPSLSYPG